MFTIGDKPSVGFLILFFPYKDSDKHNKLHRTTLKMEYISLSLFWITKLKYSTHPLTYSKGFS